MLQYQNTNIRFGLQTEDYKLQWGSRAVSAVEVIDTFPGTLSLSAGRRDWAAFQAVLWSSNDWALNTGSEPWFSQKGAVPVLRVAVDAPFPAQVHPIDMHQDNDNLWKADAILTSSVVEEDANKARAVWIELEIPADAVPGTYDCTVALYAGSRFTAETKLTEATVQITVSDCLMPKPEEQRFHLDLWQHLSNIARKHETPLWSDEHFAVLENYVRSLGELGQKAVTLVVSQVPWAGQGCADEYRMAANLYEYSIIPVTKTADGFQYDYRPMQRYIDLCAGYHIDREISIFGLANIWAGEGFEALAEDYPDKIKIRYLDEADGCYKYMTTAAEIDDYIRSLEQYFITTGQIDRVRLVADEPGDIAAYRKSLEHLHAVAPAFRCKAALNHASFIAEFEKEVDDYVPSLGTMAGEYDIMQEYQSRLTGKRFLWYVCCGPEYPNTFLRSRLTESYFIGILTSYVKLDGFLRWNYTVWNDDPRTDIRYGSWYAGDTNFVYPAANGAPLLTLRYKALKRGIQFYELMERLREQGTPEALAEAYDFVVHEKDVRQYYATWHSLEDMCSVDSGDYIRLKQYLLEQLSGKA
ncbi:MAG: DUF4091 domain-containing protein [Clostridia bacterium]|nr:DUF4091 domain-containing protein [Clostridia bacterium]